MIVSDLEYSIDERDRYSGSPTTLALRCPRESQAESGRGFQRGPASSLEDHFLPFGSPCLTMSDDTKALATPSTSQGALSPRGDQSRLDLRLKGGLDQSQARKRFDAPILFVFCVLDGPNPSAQLDLPTKDTTYFPSDTMLRCFCSTQHRGDRWRLRRFQVRLTLPFCASQLLH